MMQRVVAVTEKFSKKFGETNWVRSGDDALKAPVVDIHANRVTDPEPYLKYMNDVLASDRGEFQVKTASFNDVQVSQQVFNDGKTYTEIEVVSDKRSGTGWDKIVITHEANGASIDERTRSDSGEITSRKEVISANNDRAITTKSTVPGVNGSGTVATDYISISGRDNSTTSKTHMLEILDSNGKTIQTTVRSDGPTGPIISEVDGNGKSLSSASDPYNPNRAAPKGPTIRGFNKFSSVGGVEQMPAMDGLEHQSQTSGSQPAAASLSAENVNPNKSKPTNNVDRGNVMPTNNPNNGNEPKSLSVQPNEQQLPNGLIITAQPAQTQPARPNHAQTPIVATVPEAHQAQPRQPVTPPPVPPVVIPRSSSATTPPPPPLRNAGGIEGFVYTRSPEQDAAVKAAAATAGIKAESSSKGTYTGIRVQGNRAGMTVFYDEVDRKGLASPDPETGRNADAAARKAEQERRLAVAQEQRAADERAQKNAPPMSDQELRLLAEGQMTLHDLPSETPSRNAPNAAAPAKPVDSDAKLKAQDAADAKRMEQLKQEHIWSKGTSEKFNAYQEAKASAAPVEINWKPSLVDTLKSMVFAPKKTEVDVAREAFEASEKADLETAKKFALLRNLYFVKRRRLK